MRKNFFKLSIIIIVCIIFVTGCGKKVDKVYKYDKEDEVINNKTDENINEVSNKQEEILEENSNILSNVTSNIVSNKTSNVTSNVVSNKSSNVTSNSNSYSKNTIKICRLELTSEIIEGGTSYASGIYIIKGYNPSGKEVWSIETNVEFYPGPNHYYPFYDGKKYFYYNDKGLKAVDKDTGKIVWENKKDIDKLYSMSYWYEVKDRVIFIPFSHGNTNEGPISEFDINTGKAYKTGVDVETFLTKKFGAYNWEYTQYKLSEKDYIIEGDLVNIGDVEDYSTNKKYKLYYNIYTYELILR